MKEGDSNADTATFDSADPSLASAAWTTKVFYYTTTQAFFPVHAHRRGDYAAHRDRSWGIFSDPAPFSGLCSRHTAEYGLYNHRTSQPTLSQGIGNPLLVVIQVCLAVW